MAAERDLDKLVATMEPVVRPGRYVVVQLPVDLLARLHDDGAAVRPGGAAGDGRAVDVHATVREPEGLSAVLTQQEADRLSLPYSFVAGWITLQVHSALEAVGLTAVVSTALSEAGISCNVLAGLHHDHLLVPVDLATRAVQVLEGLSG